MVPPYGLLGQWHRIRSPKIDPNICQNLVYSKYDVLKLWRKYEDSVNVTGTIGRHLENSEVESASFTLFQNKYSLD